MMLSVGSPAPTNILCLGCTYTDGSWEGCGGPSSMCPDTCRVYWHGIDEGDPSMGYVVPAEQYQTSYRFGTLGLANDDPNYPVEGTHILTIFAEQDYGQYIQLDDGSVDLVFENIPGSNYQVAWTVIEDGVHSTSTVSDVYPEGIRHGIMVSGYDHYESYLFAGGAEFAKTSILDRTPPDCSACEPFLEPGYLRDCTVTDYINEDLDGNRQLDAGEDDPNIGVVGALDIDTRHLHHRINPRFSEPRNRRFGIVLSRAVEK